MSRIKGFLEELEFKLNYCVKYCDLDHDIANAILHSDMSIQKKFLDDLITQEELALLGGKDG